MAGTERPVQPDTAGNGDQDEARERAQTSTIAPLQGDVGTREPG